MITVDKEIFGSNAVTIVNEQNVIKMYHYRLLWF